MQGLKESYFESVQSCIAAQKVHEITLALIYVLQNATQNGRGERIWMAMPLRGLHLQRNHGKESLICVGQHTGVAGAAWQPQSVLHPDPHCCYTVSHPAVHTQCKKLPLLFV
jgi:hypothetical protein